MQSRKKKANEGKKGKIKTQIKTKERQDVNERKKKKSMPMVA